jgi:hypothetical protein
MALVAGKKAGREPPEGFFRESGPDRAFNLKK